MTRVIPKEMMPKTASFRRVHAHWTAGNHKSSPDDRTHYHFVIDGDGTFHQGVKLPSQNSLTKKSGSWAYHTLNANTGAIGISVACMALAVENPFNSGRFPMTKRQWDVMCLAIADLCETYGIPVNSKTVLSHAEVQGNLGIKQRGKWDFTRLSWKPDVKGAKACGDLMRQQVQDALSGSARFMSETDGEGDGGEPEDNTISSGVPEWVNTMQDTTGDALHWTTKMVEAGYPNGDWQVFEVQTRLKDRNYNPGGLDGGWGGMVAGAIAGFMNDSALTGKAPTSIEDFREVRDELVTELKQWETWKKVRPVSEKRKDVTEANVEKVEPAAAPVRQNFLTSVWLAIGGFATGIAKYFSDAWDWLTDSDTGTLSTVFQILKQIPTSVWFVAFGVLFVYIAYNSRNSLQKITQDVKSGERI